MKLLYIKELFWLKWGDFGLQKTKNNHELILFPLKVPKEQLTKLLRERPYPREPSSSP